METPSWKAGLAFPVYYSDTSATRLARNERVYEEGRDWRYGEFSFS